MIGLFVSLALSCMSSLYIFKINPLSVVSFTIIFSHSENYLFTLFIVSFAIQKLLSLIRSHLFAFVYFHYSRRWVIEDLALIYLTSTAGKGKSGKKKKKSKRIYRTIQNIRIVDVFLESLLSESFPSL